jgi:hypothetical protein
MSTVDPDQGWKPRPDPTILTTEQLHREIAALESRMLTETAALRTLLEASITSITEILAAQTEILDTKVVAHRELDDQRFVEIDACFAAIDRHRLEAKADQTKQNDYVIDTLKERADEHYKANRSAIEKSEQSLLATIAKQADSFATTNEADRRAANDLKERVAKIESLGEGASAQRQEGRQQISSTTAIIGAVIAIIGIGLALLVGRNSHQPTPTNTTTTIQTTTITTPATP